MLRRARIRAALEKASRQPSRDGAQRNENDQARRCAGGGAPDNETGDRSTGDEKAVPHASIVNDARPIAQVRTGTAVRAIG